MIHRIREKFWAMDIIARCLAVILLAVAVVFAVRDGHLGYALVIAAIMCLVLGKVFQNTRREERLAEQIRERNNAPLVDRRPRRTSDAHYQVGRFLDHLAARRPDLLIIDEDPCDSEYPPN